MKVVTFGEVMMRLVPPRHERFTQAREFEATYGGGECNVAVSLAQFGIESYFVSAVPNNEIGQACLNYIRQWGVDTTHVLKQGPRLGIYFLESGASMRSSKVIYDRKSSAISELSPGKIDWASVFHGKDWYHFTGITPAISAAAAATTMEAAEAAKRAGLTVSCDFNYRKNLWEPEKAQATMRPLMEYVDVAIGNEEDSEKSLGIEAKGIDVTKGQLDPEAYISVIERLVDQFRFQKIGITLRESMSANFNEWSAIFWDGNQTHIGKKYPINIVDRVGGGDAFAAGIIYGCSQGLNSRNTLDFAVASSALSHTVHGDFNLVSVEEVNLIAGGDTSGRVQR